MRLAARTPLTGLRSVTGSPALGLGSTVVSAVTQLDIATGLEDGVDGVIVAIFLDRLTAGLAERPDTGLLRTFAARRGRGGPAGRTRSHRGRRWASVGTAG